MDNTKKQETNNIEKSKLEEEHKDCLRCEHIKCIDFYREIDELEGGELYVLESTIKKRVHLPCEVGFLIRPMCQLLYIIVSNLDLISSPLYIQCIRDMKASAFLLFSSHYRNSIQVLRPVLENHLVGLYFDTRWINAETDKEKENVEEDFKDFIEGRYMVPSSEWKKLFPNRERRKRKIDHEFCVEWLVDRNIINTKFKNKIIKKFGVLNRYLHPDFTRMDIYRANCASCPATVKYDENEYRKAIKIFQDIGVLILDVLCQYIEYHLPGKVKEMENELGYVITMKDLEKKIPHKLIYSDDLSRFISLYKNISPSTP